MANISNGWVTGTRDSVTAAFARSLAAVPTNVFLDFSGESYTYEHFDHLSSHLASSFLELGVQPGDRVASMLDNSVQAVATWIAANKIGAIWVPINTANKGEFLRHPLADCGAKLVVVDAQYFDRIET
ncbi:MAG: AMP-binding protein, partial [Actinobacteria bacterium]|nr:AMP-binding protein [Actinomycetota bacterium]